MKWILLLLVLAGVAGYFTKPEEAVMRERAEAVLSDPQTISQGFEGVATALAGDRAYSNYYVAAKYNVTLDGQPVVTCWGAFQQVQCNRAADTRTGG
ncbi:MAG: hypothetical protein JNL81_14195 [Hyphomonadaceae bacterium]|nr:hypothetical protein [Hyphomonadaceae bacterium]